MGLEYSMRVWGMIKKQFPLFLEPMGSIVPIKIGKYSKVNLEKFVEDSFSKN